MMIGLGDNPVPVGANCPSGYYYVPAIDLPGVSVPAMCQVDTEDLSTLDQTTQLATSGTPVASPIVAGSGVVTLPVVTSPACPTPADPTYGSVCPSGFSLVTLAPASASACGSYECENGAGQSVAGVAASIAPAPGVAAASPCSLAWFGEQTCLTLGSFTIGQTTALAIAAGFAALFYFGRGRG